MPENAWTFVRDSLANPDDKGLFDKAYNAIENAPEGSAGMLYTQLQKHPHFWQ